MVFDVGAWKRAQSQIAASQRRMAAINKKNSRSHGGVRSAHASRSRGARATRGAGSGSGRPAPALLLKINGGGLASVDYMRRQLGAQHIDSNMLSYDTKSLLEEFRLDTARHPRVDPKNLFVHVSLSRGAGQDLTPAQWQKVVRKFLRNIGAEHCQYTATRHPGLHDHVHLCFSRSRPDGKLVSLSNNRWAWRAQVRLVESSMGLTDQPTQKDADAQTATTSDTQVNATRRAARRGTTDPFITPALISKALANATSQDHFKSNLQAVGLQVQMASKNGKTTGIVFKTNDSSEWLAGSSISRELSLPKVQAQIKLNQEMAAMRQRHQAAQAQAQQAQQTRQRGG